MRVQNKDIGKRFYWFSKNRLILVQLDNIDYHKNKVRLHVEDAYIYVDENRDKVILIPVEAVNKFINEFKNKSEYEERTYPEINWEGENKSKSEETDKAIWGVVSQIDQLARVLDTLSKWGISSNVEVKRQELHSSIKNLFEVINR